jgi:ribosomal protein L40E
MTAPRPNLNLTLDEQCFQGLLAAAFTIQEHNDRRRQTRQEEAIAEALPEAETHGICPQCGARKPSEGSRCGSCGLDELRPGERLQRNWASMWLMSQEQGLWPERSADFAGAIEKDREGTHEDGPRLSAKRPTREQTASAATTSNFLALPVAKKAGRESTSSDPGDKVHGPFNVEATLAKSSDKSRWTGEEDETAEIGAIVEDTSAESELSGPPLELSASDHSQAIAAISDETSYASDEAPSLIPRHWADLQVTLRFHRADLYLGLAVFVALTALLWPAASAPKRAALGPWERALISMGIAEAPAPVIHLQGDPGIQVWVDPHTALYYCPGSEPYGKTADGRFSSQRDAQLDRFEPDGRSACE